MKVRDELKPDEAAVKAYNEKAADWYGTCRKCGEQISGTLSEIRAHRCKIGE